MEKGSNSPKKSGFITFFRERREKSKSSKNILKRSATTDETGNLQLSFLSGEITSSAEELTLHRDLGKSASDPFLEQYELSRANEGEKIVHLFLSVKSIYFLIFLELLGCKLSRHKLSFGLKGDLLPVTEKDSQSYLTEKIQLSNNSPVSLYYQVELPVSPKYEILVSPLKGELPKVKKRKKINLKFTNHIVKNKRKMEKFFFVFKFELFVQPKFNVPFVFILAKQNFIPKKIKIIRKSKKHLLFL